MHKISLLSLLRQRILGTRAYSTSDNSVILTETKSCGVITLNRPRVLNSLNLPMIRLIYPQLKKWNEDSSISHVLIEGTGNKAFCAGGDVRSVTEAARNGDQASEAFFREEYQLNHLIGSLNKPFIALLNGITMGGGVGLSIHGNYRVATENTLFSMPETAIGLFPDVGGGYALPRLPYPGLGLLLALTGLRLKGLEVQWAGVATHYCPSENITELKETLCHLSSPNQATKNQAIERILNKHTKSSSVPVRLAPHLHSIETIFSLFNSTGERVTVEDVLQKLTVYGSTGPDNKEWADNILKTMSRLSPTSLKVTLRQLQKGSKLSFADNFKMEFRLSQRFVRGHDFFEGVRAILVDKDNHPTWNPDKLSDVSVDAVNDYFTLVPGVSEWCP